ncbi:hypothetical protein GOP47_0023814 [Adiantum capillus-veneris]|uniref:Cytochrome P450 n=1 Tax=Adiantum capillus-veneris TaxID=13818 RepID=A0A9D4U471_ADICA|nr:hypothetical protein GOP47_0023814 [Adiantum capillus-veneris]
MESLVLAFIILLISAILLFRISARARKRPACRLPPGPPGLPLIGHLHLLGQNPHQTFFKLSQQHGPLFSLRLGSIPAVVASSPAVAKQILQTHDHLFASRLPTIADSRINRHRNIRAAQPGPYWRLIRQICAMEFFTPKRLEAFRPIRAEEVGDLVRAVLCESRGGQCAIAIRSHLYTISTNIISRMMLGKRLAELTASQADPSLHIRTLIPNMMRLSGSFNLADLIPCLSWLDIQGIAKESEALGHKINTVFQEVIDRRRCEAGEGGEDSGRPRDFLDTLLQAASSSKYKEINITDENVNAVLLNMFSGGTDTSSLMIEWALAELLANPEKLKLAQEELVRVVGTTRPISELDIPHLPYLQAVVKETMRLHPTGPLLIPHFTNEPCKIFDYEIPSKTLAFVNVWAIGRDPKTWKDPLKFYPERFFDSDIDPRGQHFELLPFGSGRRICPGLALGLVSVNLVLGSLIHCFDWMLVEELSFCEKFNLVLGLANPLVAKPTPKLPEHVIHNY